jgi:hypothetical protein
MKAGRPLLLLLGLLLVAAPVRADIVITEIMYDTPGFPDVDYVEIYNDGSVPQDLAGWYLLDDIDTHDKCFLVGMLGPGDYWVVPGNLALFNAKYPTVTNFNPNQFESEIEGHGFFLGDGGDMVRVFGPGDVLMDSVLYNDTSPWPIEPDGDGPSLELYHPSLDNELPYNWAASTNGYPEGTPGAQNTVFTTDQPPFITVATRDIPLPRSSDTVAVTACVADGQGLSGVELLVDSGSGFVPQLMFVDGPCGPGDAYSLFGALIAAQPGGTLVRYYVLATDTIAQTSTLPTGAPANYFGYTVDHEPPRLRINEIVAVNMNGPVDDFGITEDWLEIHNPGPEPVSLAGMFLSNNLLQSAEWQLPNEVIGPGEFRLVWCDDDDAEGPWHTDFKLAKAGSEIALWESIDHGNVLIHGFEFGIQSADVSFGYLPDDADAPEYIATPTPAASNNGSPLFSPICINEFQTTSTAGGPDDWVEFYNRGDTSVDMSGWHLSDEADEPTKFVFPQGVVVGQGSYIAIDELTLGFGFKSDGSEAIMLCSGNATVGQDFFDYGRQDPDISQGRMPNGTSNWHFFVTTTRGYGNHCFGVPPLGSTANHQFSSPTTMSWDPAPDAEAYDTLRGDLGALLAASGDYSVAVAGCLKNNGRDSLSWDPSTPAPGEGFFYLVRAVDYACGFGTYDTGSPSQHASRDVLIEAAPFSCP